MHLLKVQEISLNMQVTENLLHFNFTSSFKQTDNTTSPTFIVVDHPYWIVNIGRKYRGFNSGK